MDEVCNCARGLGTAAVALVLAIAVQSMAATVFLLAAMVLA